MNTAKIIKKTILEQHEKYNLDAVALENYETLDIQPWLTEQQIPAELVTPTSQLQNAAFPEMHRIFKEGRFHFPEDLKDFASELSTFVYEQPKSGEYYKFHHSHSKFFDDRVYSTCWALWSLRREHLVLYELLLIQCHSKSQHRHLCFLMGGDMILPGCSQECYAYHQCEEMFRQYKQYQTESEINLVQFFQAYVKIGTKIYQAV